MIDITPASEADLACVQDLAQRVWRQHYPGIIGVEQIEYMLKRGYATGVLAEFLVSRGAGLALARVNDAPVGFVAWCRAAEPATTKLEKLYVLEPWQRRGVGRRLIYHVEAAARADAAATLILNVNKHNTAAIAAYRRCGFGTRDEVVVDIGGGFVIDDYRMARPL